MSQEIDFLAVGATGARSQARNLSPFHLRETRGNDDDAVDSNRTYASDSQLSCDRPYD
jgi:hypothetical protein